MSITVSLVEDHRETRKTLGALLDRAPTIRRVGSHSSAETALDAIPAERPDVALIDINLPGMSGIDLVAKLKAKLPGLHVLILTSYEETQLIFDALRAGASGYLLKKSVPAELLPAIELVYGGGAPMSVQIAREVVKYFHQADQRDDEVARLAPREQEILALLAKGHLYKEIGDQLHLSTQTVKWYLHRIYEKLHVQTRTEAAAKFLNRKR